MIAGGSLATIITIARVDVQVLAIPADGFRIADTYVPWCTGDDVLWHLRVACRYFRHAATARRTVRGRLYGVGIRQPQLTSRARTVSGSLRKVGFRGADGIP